MVSVSAETENVISASVSVTTITEKVGFGQSLICMYVCICVYVCVCVCVCVVLVYLCLCLFPLLGLVCVPVINLMATRNRRRDGDAVPDEFEVDETTPPGVRTVSTHSVVMIQSVLIKPFNSYMRSAAVDVGWMTVILLRNFIICTSSSLLQHVPAVRSILVTCLCFFFVVDQLISRGYLLSTANRIDIASWLMLSLLSTLDIYASVVYEEGQAQSTWSAADWFARLIASVPLIIIMVAVIVFFVRVLLRRIALSRRTSPH